MTETRQFEIDSQVVQQHNCNAYKSWSCEDATEWIISISSKFEKYREALNNSFKNNHFNVESIVDHQDLEQYGIIDLDDRKTIYTAITQLIATQTTESQEMFDTQYKEIETSQLSASDDEDESERDYSHSQGTPSSVFSGSEDEKKSIEDDYNLELQRQNLMDNGYCKWISDKSYKEIMITLTDGYARTYYEADDEFPLKLNQDIFRVIRQFYGITFGIGGHIKLRLGTDHLYLTTITNISLSTVLCARLEASDSNVIAINEKKVPSDALEHILMYLGHHKGVEPDKLPCPVRSIHMKEICSDRWDADWMDGFDKKTIFEVILAAHHLDITCLVHLGSAKIATLIKQLDQKEINRIIEEEEKYRREHANNNESEDEEEQKQSSSGISGPSIVMLDELVSIFDHDYDEIVERENEQTIQGIDDEKDKVKIDDAQNNDDRIQGIHNENNKKLSIDPAITILDELLSIFDY